MALQTDYLQSAFSALVECGASLSVGLMETRSSAPVYIDAVHAPIMLRKIFSMDLETDEIDDILLMNTSVNFAYIEYGGIIFSVVKRKIISGSYQIVAIVEVGVKGGV